MLSEFLTDHRSEILNLAKEKMAQTGPAKLRSEELDRGLPMFYTQLINVLKRVASSDTIGHPIVPNKEENSKDDAERYGREAGRLGYSVSQVVHAYGALCQAITEYAHDRSQIITPKEFHGFNFTLDAAVAEAVTEFVDVNKKAKDADFQAQLGTLAHELRNPISNAIMALEAIRLGSVGVGGNTGQLLERALQRMKELVERALEVARAKNEVQTTQINLGELIDEVADAAEFNCKSRRISLQVEVSDKIHLDADRQQLSSAISNLVQNAVKFTKSATSVWVRATKSNERILIEVEDRCGGLPPGATGELFKPGVQKDENKTGCGLGLYICQRAVVAHNGQISVRNLPGVGCVFSIDLPEKAIQDEDALEFGQVPRSGTDSGREITSHH